MITIKSLVALALVSATVVVLSGCVTSGTACNPEITRVSSAPAPAPEPQVVTRDVPGPERVVVREVPGPERIIYSTVTVTQEVPGPERVVIKEVPVEKEVTKQK